MSTTSDRIELLESFVRIAETGGIGAAARSLDTSQPTISRRLQQLEGILSAKLVERDTQGLNLTPAGANLLPEAREMIARWRALEQSVEAEVGEIAGVVRVAATTALGGSALTDLVGAFIAQYPEVQVELRLIDGAFDMAAEGVDFAIRLGKPGAETGASCEIAQTRHVLCASPALADRLESEHGISIEGCEPLALEGAPLVAVGPMIPTPIRFFGRRDETVDVVFDMIAACDDAPPVLRMATLGLGLAVLPTWLIRPYLADGRLLRVAAGWAAEEQGVTLAWTPSRFHSAAASALMEIVREELPPLLDA